MNHRIRKIAEQVGYKPVQGAEFFNSIEDIFYQKFAEAIIRECSKVNNQFIGHRIGEIDLDLVYKEHFGVE